MVVKSATDCGLNMEHPSNNYISTTDDTDNAGVRKIRTIRIIRSLKEIIHVLNLCLELV